MSLAIAQATETADLEACLELRRIVFIQEQRVSEADERDGRDGTATHLLARLDGAPVGTLRIRILGPAAKLERVCVLAAHRREGIGTALTRAAIERMTAAPGITEVKLGAQVPVIGFYERLGFTALGEIYMDAGIPHRDMIRPLPAH